MKGRCYLRHFLAKLGGLVFVFLPVAPTDSYAQPAPIPASVNAAQGDFAGLVEIDNGRRLYLECHGVGSPTVILESGFRNTATVWTVSDGLRQKPVLSQIAEFTTFALMIGPERRSRAIN